MPEEESDVEESDIFLDLASIDDKDNSVDSNEVFYFSKLK